MQIYCSGCNKCLTVPDFLKGVQGCCPFCNSQIKIEEISNSNSATDTKDNVIPLTSDEGDDVTIMTTCPWCSELIPENESVCRFCKKQI